MNVTQYATQNTKPFDKILTQSSNMQNVIEQAKKFAKLNAPLLIEGETGTGKDLLAKACHQFSHRAEQKFIAVNCAGLPEEEAETEMFGHRGTQNESMGFFEYANGGTVLLDAVSELSLDMQAKLLRFLNDGSFRRVGEDQERKVDIRVICTSQKPLNQLVAGGKVREDLYYRLNVLTLKLPPLRERLDDLPLLVEHFVSEISNQLGVSKLEYDHAFLNVLSRYSWVGNLRELHNVLYRACTLAHSNRLSVKDLNLPNTALNMAEIATHLPEKGTLDEMMAQYEAELLRKFYAEYPSTRKLAQRLGISHTAIANKLRAYGINSK